ncbi:hypothetical protein [Paenibacillus alvei]|uniref:hypothetical protein n=1 Tax=Paenibacillus alvei TaxID=44250 RepID=UPI00042871DD|nr:hypothetical protein [Paenibacillus alvei]
MKDWREELNHKPVTERKQAKSPHLCNCMAAMRGRWVDGVYMCIKCQKPVYG